MRAGAGDVADSNPETSFRRKPESRGTGIARNVWIPAFAGMTVSEPV